MSLSFLNYHYSARVVSLAFNEHVSELLRLEGLDYIFLTNEHAVLFPDEIRLFPDEGTFAALRRCSNYDVLLIDSDGKAFRCYDDSSEENVIFITATCNSNCIMCPMPEKIRRNGETYSIDLLLNIASHIPDDASHLTITGGEPYMAGYRIFDLFKYLKEKFRSTEFLLLTNGRALAIKKYAEKTVTTLPGNTIVGIPIHGSRAEIHDHISRALGSFEQTTLGLHHLMDHQVHVELRIVVSKLNADDFTAIAELIVREFYDVFHVSVMAVEMTGNAFKNKDQVWLSYRNVFKKIEKGINILVEHGIDVLLFNFPLCTVDATYRTLCRKSISPSKVRYADICENCCLHDACGGVFAGTIWLVAEELRPIR